MTQEEVLKTVIDRLHRIQVPYMLTGAIAVNYYGRPRLTHDLDLVVELESSMVKRIVVSLQSDFYVATEGILEALRHRTMFNALHQDTGLKVDFWLKGADRYDAARFQRRKRRKIFDRMMFITTAEDLITMKLKWYRDSSSEKHYLDALGVYQIQKDHLDLSYMKEWLSHFSITDLFERLKAKADNTGLSSLRS